MNAPEVSTTGVWLRIVAIMAASAVLMIAILWGLEYQARVDRERECRMWAQEMLTNPVHSANWEWARQHRVAEGCV